jgi:hypothetical protein
MVILHGEARSGKHSHWREAGLIQLWWIQGAIIATFTAMRVVDKIKTKGPLQWGFNGWTFSFIFFYTMTFFLN